MRPWDVTVASLIMAILQTLLTRYYDAKPSDPAETDNRIISKDQPCRTMSENLASRFLIIFLSQEIINFILIIVAN